MNAFRWRAEDALGLSLIVLIGGGGALFRAIAIIPRAMVGACAAANPPAICAPRAAVLWLQYQQGFGWAALVLGLIGFVTGHRWTAILAVGLGIAAVVNYNATTGVIGAALGLYAWLGLASGRYGRDFLFVNKKKQKNFSN